MKTVFKIISVTANLADYAAGIAAVAILLLKKDFISIFFIPGMTSMESLFFNLIMFEIGLALLMKVSSLLIGEYAKKGIEIEFPTIYGIIPLITGAISIYLAFTGDTLREKILVIVSAILYVLLSATVIYNGAKIFAKDE